MRALRDTVGIVIVANLLVLLANLGVLAITVKLYTEILKDARFEGRAKKHGHDGGTDAAR